MAARLVPPLPTGHGEIRCTGNLADFLHHHDDMTAEVRAGGLEHRLGFAEGRSSDVPTHHWHPRNGNSGARPRPSAGRSRSRYGRDRLRSRRPLAAEVIPNGLHNLTARDRGCQMFFF